MAGRVVIQDLINNPFRPAMNEQSDLHFFIQLVFGIWAVFCFFAVPIWISQIAKNSKRMADSLQAIARGQ
jgi:hypothetical protein